MGLDVTKLLANVGAVHTSGLSANRYGTAFREASYATSVPHYKSPVYGNTVPNADKLANYHVPGLVCDYLA